MRYSLGVLTGRYCHEIFSGALTGLGRYCFDILWGIYWEVLS